MKKVYEKPAIYCEDYKTGVISTNSKEFAEKVKTDKQIQKEVQRLRKQLQK